MDTLSILYIGKNTETLETIRQYDSDITHVNSPEEGLDQFSMKAIDALIVESGDEMKESLSAIEKFKIRKKNLLCVIITAYPDQESLIRSISIGLSDILIHPFEPSAIDALIKKLRVSALLNRQLSQKNLLLNQYKNALDASLIIARTDTSGNIIYINDKFCDITGYTPSEIIGHTHRLFKHPETPTEQMVQLWNTISAKRVWHGTVINLTKKGETFYTDTFVIPILNEQHEIVEYMDMRIDITEIKTYLQIIQTKVDEATKAIQAQQQQLIAQSRAAALGEMFDNIAHQWRQPIGAINNAIINAEFAIELGSIQESAVLETFEQIKTYTAFLSKTIDDFRNFSNPDKEKTHFSLHSSISQTINIIRGAYEMNHISLGYIPDDLLRNVEVYGPQGEFSQVILNILGNARDAIKEKQLQNGQVRIKVSAGNKTISLSISDNAGGIPEAVLPKIFDPYFSTKGQAQGTGIGLYMSKTIIEKHFYGNLEADNEEDGAIFTITLPIYQAN